MNRTLSLSISLVLTVACLTNGNTSSAQFAPPQEQTIKITQAPGQEIELEALVEIISHTLKINISYNKQKLANKKIAWSVAQEVKVSDLMGVLQSALRTHGMALVEDDVSGFRRIVDKSDLPNLPPTNRPAAQVEREFGGPTYATRQFVLKHIDAASIKPLIEFFISKEAPRPIIFDKQNSIAVTARTGVLKSIETLLSELDVPQPTAQYTFYTVRNLTSEELQPKLLELVKASTPSNDSDSIKILNIERTNQLVLIGPQDAIRATIKLAERLDVSLGRSTKVYTLKYVSAQRIDELMKKLLPQKRGAGTTETAVDEESNLLIVTATADVHKQIAAMIKQMDTKTRKEKSPVRFYKLKNISAVAALETIRALQGLSYGPVLGQTNRSRSPRRDAQYEGFPNRNNPPFNGRLDNGFGPPYYNQPFNPPGFQPFNGGFNGGFNNQNGRRLLPLGTSNSDSYPPPGGSISPRKRSARRIAQNNIPYAGRSRTPSSNTNNLKQTLQNKPLYDPHVQQASWQNEIPTNEISPNNSRIQPTNQPFAPPNQPAGASNRPHSEQMANQPPNDTFGSAATFSESRAQVTADTNTNSLIIIADPATHRIYEELIKKIDRRSPQVLIEAKIVTIDTTDKFALGIEISGGDRKGDKKFFGFSRFGLSEVDASNGALTLVPGLGFNGALIDPEVADVILRALSSHTRAKVIASPRILVNENAEGIIESVVSVPFSSVNASNTVSSTSLGGNQEAGTKISVIPHISEGDHLELDFSIEFSAFQDGGDAGLPPPRQINSIQSVATIPDGHTVIVGGLNRVNEAGTVTTIPLIENIPLLRKLARNQTRNGQNTALFIFIRPIILRDDKFRNLRFLSDQAEKKSGTQLPPSCPLIMK